MSNTGSPAPSTSFEFYAVNLYAFHRTSVFARCYGLTQMREQDCYGGNFHGYAKKKKKKKKKKKRAMSASCG